MERRNKTLTRFQSNHYKRAMLCAAMAALVTACGGGGGSSGGGGGATDNTPKLEVTSVTPQDGATGVAPDVTLQVEFNRDLLVSSINESGALVLASGEGGSEVPLTVNIDTASSATLQPDTSLELLTEYSVTATTAITDTGGRALNDEYQWQFMTRDGSWGDASLIENQNGDATSPALAVDPAGNAMVVWHQSDSGTDEVMFRYYDAAADGWVPASSLDSGSYGISDPDVAMDASGNALAVWNRQVYDNGSYYQQVFARRWSSDTESWGSTELISSNNIEGFFDPGVAFDDSGNAMAVWIKEPADSNNPDRLAYNRFDADAGGWGSPQTVLDIDKATYEALDMDVDPAGNAVVVWVNASDDYLPDAQNSVQATRFDSVTENWSAPIRLDSYDAPGEAHDPQVLFDLSGNAHVAWWRSRSSEPRIFGQVYANRYDVETGGWKTSATRILGGREEDEGRFPALAVNNAGDAVMIFELGEVYVSRFPGGDAMWTQAEQASDSGGGPQGDIAIDDSGNALVVWKKDEDTATNIFASRSAGVAPAWTDEARIETLGSIAQRPLLEMDASGNAVAVWADTGSIYSARFNFE